MSDLKTATFNFHKEFRKITDHAAAIQTKHAAAVTDLQAHKVMLPTSDQMAEDIPELVQRQAERAIGIAPGLVLDAIAGELRERTIHTEDGYRTEGMVRNSPSLPFLPTIGLSELCALAPGFMVQVMTEFVKLHHPGGGIRREDLPAVVAEKTARVREIEDEHTAIVDAAAEAGLTLALLPAVQERRNIEARAAELLRERMARKDEAIAAINRANPQR